MPKVKQIRSVYHRNTPTGVAKILTVEYSGSASCGGICGVTHASVAGARDALWGQNHILEDLL